jgi:hypothetical protein
MGNDFVRLANTERLIIDYFMSTVLVCWSLTRSLLASNHDSNVILPVPMAKHMFSGLNNTTRLLGNFAWISKASKVAA